MSFRDAVIVAAFAAAALPAFAQAPGPVEVETTISPAPYATAPPTKLVPPPPRPPLDEKKPKPN